MGLLLGAPLAIELAFQRGLSLWIELLLIAVAVSMLLLVPLTVKVFTGKEGFVFYRDVICIFAAVSAVLHWLHRPVLAYLDITIAAAGVFHACGRIGCLLSSCCHGRPSRWGIRYGQAHVDMGFTPQLIGVRLFPIQAVESFFILCLSIMATIFILGKNPPGMAFAFYVSGYAFVRFWTELARGDLDRPYLFGFSQAQWISVLLAFGVASAGYLGVLPASRWHLAVAADLVLSVGMITTWRRLERTRSFELLRPHHLLELADGLRHLALCFHKDNHEHKNRIDVLETSLGFRISAGEIARESTRIRHYSLSRSTSPLDFRTARILANEISLLEHSPRPFKLIPGRRGIFHLLIRPSSDHNLRSPGPKSI